MRLFQHLFAITFAVLLLPAHADSTFSGDTKLACEAILCLATQKDRPSQCTPSVQRYRGIKLPGYGETIDARRRFLESCPQRQVDAKMSSLLRAESEAEEYCDPYFLNRRFDPRIALKENRLDANVIDRGCGTGMWCPGETMPPISNTLPPECQALADHPSTADSVPRYVGTPELFGRWVKPEDYAKSLADYNASIPAMQAAKAAAEAEAAGGGQ